MQLVNIKFSFFHFVHSLIQQGYETYWISITTLPASSSTRQAKVKIICGLHKTLRFLPRTC